MNFSRKGNKVTLSYFFLEGCSHLLALHQRFTHAFFVQNFGAKNYKAAQSALVQNFGAKTALSYEKRAHEMLMKFTPFFFSGKKMQLKKWH